MEEILKWILDTAFLKDMAMRKSVLPLRMLPVLLTCSEYGAWDSCPLCPVGNSARETTDLTGYLLRKVCRASGPKSTTLVTLLQTECIIK